MVVDIKNYCFKCGLCVIVFCARKIWNLQLSTDKYVISVVWRKNNFQGANMYFWYLLTILK
jgi:hypothetical protein